MEAPQPDRPATRLVLLMLIAAVLAGCNNWGWTKKPALLRREGPYRVDLDFRGVRTMSDGADELARIRTAVESGGGVIVGEQRLAEPRSITGGQVRDIRLLVEVPDLGRLASIDQRLFALESERRGNTITSFAVDGVGLRYISPYLGGRVEKVYIGEASPGATIRLHSNNGTDVQTIPVRNSGGRGVYRVPIEMQARQRYLYLSIEIGSPSVTRFQRIDIATQVQQDLSRDEFQRLVSTEP